jgi:hypothetical protein
MKSEATINNRAKRHLAGGLSLRRVSPQASAAWQATYWGCGAPQPENDELLSTICEYTQKEIFPLPQHTTPPQGTDDDDMEHSLLSIVV